MKNIRFILAAILFSLSLQSYAIDNEPKLTVYVDSISYQRLSNNDDVCCFYQIKLNKQTDGKTIIYHSQTGVVVGTVYGTITPDYLMWLKENVLTDESVEDIVTKFLKSGIETNKPGL